jgi:hypothetical protein
MKVHKNNILKSTLIATVGALVASSPAFAATLTNGDFEQFNTITNPEGLNPPSATNGLTILNVGSTVVTGWTAIAGGGGGGALYQGNNRVSNNGALSRTVALNANNAQGGISTIVSGLIQGQTLNVFFDLSGTFSNPGTRPRVSVTLDNGGDSQLFCLGGNIANCQLPISTVPGAFGAQRNNVFQTFVASFIYTGTSATSTLSFQSLSGNAIGPIIDNVTLTPIPFEFSPVTGFIAGGVLFGSYKLIKRKKSIA